MSQCKFVSLSGQGHPGKRTVIPADAIVQSVWMDGNQVPGCMFNEAFWIKKPCEDPSFVTHDSDELFVFLSGDVNNPESLGAEIEFWLENDKIIIKSSCSVWIPKRVAHGRITVKNIQRPVFCYRCHLNQSFLKSSPAVAKVAHGTYSNATSVVERYERADGTLPFMPFEGFTKLLVWLDSDKLAGAPYMEGVWFCMPKPEKDEMDIPHTHPFNEFLGCIGGDPEHPEDLGGEIHFFLENEEIITDKSFLLFVPEGVHHCPMLIPKMDRPIIHFTGGNAGKYAMSR